MHKICTYLRRMKTMSLKRMVMYAKKAQAESGKPLLIILADMLYCSVKYGVGYLDYLSFGFVHLNAETRRTFMTMNDNLRLVRKLNDPEKKDLFEDKLKFLKKFPEYVKRDFVDLRETDLTAFSEFCSRHPVFFAKETDSFGGLGVTRVRIKEERDIEESYERLKSEGKYCVEQEVIQHLDMNRLSQKSVNTIRMVTVLKDGKPSVMYSLLRMGNGSTYVDNISSGGMYCPLDKEGRITAPAFCDKTGEYYNEHPVSGTPLKGFGIPMFDKAVELVKSAALVVPEVRYVGWDVAISPEGPVIIEGNTLPSYDMCQNYRHLGRDKIGVKPEFRRVLGDEFD